MPTRKLIYLASLRGVSRENVGTKARAFLACWKARGYTVQPLWGGELPGGTPEKGTFGQTEFHQKWYRRNALMAPVVNSVSEYRDIHHNKATIEHLRRVANTFHPDLIWERSMRLHCPGLVVSRELGIPYVHEWKDNLIAYPLSIFRKRAIEMEARKNREADFVVVESEVLREDLIKEGVSREKIYVAHNAADPSAFFHDEAGRLQWRAELDLDESELLIGYLGSYTYYHDAIRLVLAANLVQKRLPGRVRFLMVGGGKDYVECRKTAETLGLLSSSLIMRPGIPAAQVRGLLSALDMAVLPGSTDIICPVKIPEYMAAELPTLAPDYPCNREVIEHRKSGMLFAPRDEISLADKICELVADKELRKCLGQNARQRVKEKFTWEATWGTTLERIFERAIKARSHPSVRFPQ